MIMPHILIAEDEGDVREFLVRAVRRMAPTAEVTAASNGEEALNIFQQQPCDLILTDQRMPVMRGIELLTAVREMGSSVPVVFITADVIVEEQALQAGANAVFFKPVSIRQIREIIETWMHSEST
jgi:two-component system capsular synthesis sensor histidine kinase RcsC